MHRGSSRILLVHFWIYPSMFRQVIAIIRRSWFPQKLLKQSVLWMYMDYGPCRVVNCRGMVTSKHSGVNPEMHQLNTATFSTHLLVVL
jgi:hypothetical protein